MSEESKPFHQCRLCGHPNDEYDPFFMRHAASHPKTFAWCCYIIGYHAGVGDVDTLATEGAQTALRNLLLANPTEHC